MFPTLNIGGAAIQLPGLILLVSVWIALTMAEREAKSLGRASDPIYRLSSTILFSGLIGARLGYVLTHLNAYKNDPLGIIALDTSTFNSAIGLFIALLVGYGYGKYKKMPFWQTLDILTPSLAILGVGIGMAHLASGDAYGTPTALSWGITLWGADRHPTQIYEIMAAALIWMAVLLLPTRSYAGRTFLTWLTLSAAARLLIEAWRGDSPLIAGLRLPQLVALVILLLSLWKMGRLRSTHLTAMAEKEALAEETTHPLTTPLDT